MERGLNGAGDGLLLIKNNRTNKLKIPRRGKTGQLAGLARQGKVGRAGQDRTGNNQGNIDDELARDCKHKEIIKGANEEGNKINTGGENNQ